MKKRIVSVMLVLIMICMFTPQIAFAIAGSLGSDITWVLEDGTLTIEGTGPMRNYDYSNSPFYMYGDRIKTVSIQNGVTSIGDYVFSDCYMMESISIPESVITIGNSAFEYCSALDNVNIPDGVTTIGNNAFEYCSALSNISISESVKSIGDYAFSSCESLQTINIPDGVTTIGNSAFYVCDSVGRINIPKSVTNIGYRAFTSCDSLDSIDVDSSNNTYISVNGVLYNKDITELICYPGGKIGDYVVPEGVTTIADYAFADNEDVVVISLPESVAKIGNYAFINCKNIKNISFSSNINDIGFGVFSLCNSLESIDVDISNDTYTSVNGVLYNKDITELICCPGGKTGDYVIPENVEVISDYAFDGCAYLSSIKLPDSICDIGKEAFFNCSGIESIIIPEGVSNIGDYTFQNCKNLKFISLPQSVKSIGENSFAFCESLESINLPESITTIGDGAFYNCKKLKKISIPKGINFIDDGAFSYCSSLTDVYYGGNEIEWNSIDIGSYNEILTNATINYNSQMPNEVSMSFENEILTVNSSIAQISDLMIAYYDREGTLIKCDKAEHVLSIGGNEFIVDSFDEGLYVKFMLWDKNMKPLCILEILDNQVTV